MKGLLTYLLYATSALTRYKCVMKVFQVKLLVGYNKCQRVMAIKTFFNINNKANVYVGKVLT